MASSVDALWVVAGERPQRQPGLRIGNRFFNAAFTQHVAGILGTTKIAGISLPELNVMSTHWSMWNRMRHRNRYFIEGHELHTETLIQQASNGKVDVVEVRGWGMRIEYFAATRRAWQEKTAGLRDSIVSRQTDGSVALHIRTGDALDSAHPDYFPLPLSFYEHVIDQSGLSPVFVGQVDSDNWYVRRLREKFKGARFISGRAMADFAFLVAAPVKVLSISSFAWAASWMSPNHSRTLIPSAGLFSPIVRPDIDLNPGRSQGYFAADFPPVSRRDYPGTQELLAALDDFAVPGDWWC